VALAFGDLDTADDVALLVPGVGNSPGDDLDRLAGDARDLQDAASAVAPGRAVAAVVWLGYRTPDLLAALSRAAAHRGAPALAGALAGLAGGMYTIYNGSIAPNVMGLTPMSIYVTMIVVGGLGTVSGPIIGTVLISIVQQALIDHPGTQLTVLGAILLAIVIFFPRGIAEEAAKVQRRVVAWMDEEDLAAPAPAELATGRGA
jgi:hypothetical protein